MSNGNFQHESDDELLSAYIDGELSETERATVEARLASDPEAQQLVHQLRSVSQSVQRLPLETVGRDLSEAILRRAEALKPTLAGGGTASAKAGDALPKISIFQTRRSWLWASLAVAAGLLIMVVERGAENRDQPLAAVTNESKPAPKRELEEKRAESANRLAPASVDEFGDARKSVVATPATSGDAAPAAAPANTQQDPQMLADRPAPTSIAVADNLGRDKSVALSESAAKDTLSTAGATPMRSDVPTDEEIRTGRIATNRAASPPPTNLKVAEGAAAPATSAPTPLPPGPVEEKRDMPLGDASERFAGGGRGGGGGQPAPAAPGVAGQPPAGYAVGGERTNAGEGRQEKSREDARRPAVVVHLVATPESFQKKSFDKVLVSHGVVVEPQAVAADGARGAGQITHFYKQSDGKEVAGAVAGAPTSGSADFDLVLVEAPKATIASCLTDLKNDAANFVSLEVDEQVANKAKTELGGALSKQLDSDFGRFNRGTVTPQQKESFRGRGYDVYYDYLDTEQLQRESIAADRFGGAVKGEAPTEEAKSITQQTRGAKVQGRARRLSSSGREGEKPAELAGTSGPSDARSMERSTMRRAQVDDKSKAPVGAAGGVAPVENLQVLFVVSPQPPAEASAPAKDASK